MPKDKDLDVAYVICSLASSEQTMDRQVEQPEQHRSPSRRGERILAVLLGAGLGF
jgi:hypothetical protein